ncbi:hypothetical protein B2J93_3251 [Marssonina coronariae]|uniref:Anaphase-promoting complex subunit 4-like WD40 domain-containing protein n=1 Tax=Diplocarpon coronariae TaxID=2795749 RepID=A0A218Z7N9_9HELO|nr:hypothetical protein B2J93_3251 [Marssonina coronariae]
MSIFVEKILAASPSTERGKPTQLSADPKGERIAYASGKSVFLRSIDDPSISKQYTAHTTQTSVARFSPSGFYVASGDASGAVKVWDAVEGVNTKGEFHIISGRINDIAWDGDSQRIIAVGDGRERFGHCITADSGNSVGEISGHSSAINSVSIRQQRPLRAATGADDSSMVFLHGAPFKYANKLGGLHKGYVYGTGFSPDGNHLISVGADRRIQLYDGKTGEATAQIGEGQHKGSIFAVSWANDCKRFVTASADQTVKLWDVEAGKAVQSWKFGEGNVSIPDHQVGVVWPAGRSDGLVVSLNLAGDLNYLVEGSRIPSKIVQGHNKSITALGSSISSEGKDQTFWTGDFGGRIVSWNFGTGIGSAVDGETHKNQVTAFENTSDRAYSVGWDDTLRIAESTGNTFLGETSKLSAQPKGLASAGGRVFAATNMGIDVFFKDGLVDSIPTKGFTPTAIAASGSLVAVGDDMNIVHVYNVDANHQLSRIGELTKSTSQITALAFSADGSFLAVGNSSGKIVVYDSSWEVKTDRWSAHTARVTSIAWNAEGTLAVSGALDTNIFVWSLKNPGKRFKVANAHKDGVNGVSWVHGGKKIVSTGGDAALKIWSVSVLIITPNNETTKMSSPSASEAPAPPSTRRYSRSKRGKLRNGTFILPGTGERVRRQITLRNHSNFEGLGRSFSTDSGILPLRRAYSQAGTFRTAVDNVTEAWWDSWAWMHTPVAKGIFKCSLAYLLGSMATFLPPLANFLGHQDGKHLVATITVYFHPSRSQGSMQEAILLGLGAFFYAVFISVSSMATSVFFESQLGMIELGYVLVLILFVGGGLGFVGWFKQKYNAPLVSVSCSLTSLAIITVLTKENAIQVGVFSNDKIIQVMKMVMMGMVSTSLVSLLIWPISARTEIRETMIQATDSLSEMLVLVTRGFLSGSETELKSSNFNKAQSRYKSVFCRLQTNLKEAKFEHYLLGTEEQYKLQASLVTCMQTLSQSIGGLRSAANTQFSLLGESSGAATPLSLHISEQLEEHVVPKDNIRPDRDRFDTLTAIEEAPEEGSGIEEQVDEEIEPLSRSDRQASAISFASSMPVRTPSEIFARFIMHLGPSMKSLAYTISQILQELPFGEGPRYEIKINSHFTTSLTEALKLYSSARSEALKELYRSKELDRERPESIEADFEEVASSCGYFSFSLEDLASETQNFLSILSEYQETTEKPDSRSWNWLRFWKSQTQRHKRDANTVPEEEERLISQPQQSVLPKDVPDLVFERRKTKQWQNSTNEENKKWSIYHKILNIVLFLSRDDIRFAAKVGFGASAYAMFAFIPLTRPLYQHWRGEWGLLSYILSIKDDDDDDDEGGVVPIITEIALHRVVAVLVGCAWGLVITRVIWPISARQKFKDGLSLLWLRMGLIWKRDPLSTLLEGESTNEYMDLREEFALHQYILRLESLRSAAMSEFELRGPFPAKSYERIMESTNKMLDAFHAMNVVIQKDLNASEGETLLLKYTTDERAQLCSRISHLFQVLASSLKLEFPLSDAIPSTSNARDRLLAKIFQYRKNVASAEQDPNSPVVRDEDYEMIYAYILVTGQLAEELKRVETEIEDIFGVMDENLFRLV